MAISSISYFLAAACTNLVALRTPQKSRPALSILFLSFSSLSFQKINNLGLSADHASVVGLFLLIWSLHVICVLLLEKHPPCSDWQSAYKMMFNVRWIGTSKQVPGLSISPAQDPAKEDPSHHLIGINVNRRWRFVQRRFLSAAAIFTVDYLYTQMFHVYQPLHYDDFLPSKQIYFRRLGSVTARETLTRTWIVFHFVWSAWTVFTGIHHVFAMVFVASKLDKPEDWPQLYGSPYQMYSVRRFWKGFWHQLVTVTNINMGRRLARDSFSCRAGTVADRLITNFTVFFISGAVHGLVTWQLGFTCGYWQDVAWFLCNFVALVVEEFAQKLVRRSLWLSRMCARPGLRKAIGSIWVFAFFFWSLPKTQYPKIVCNAV